MIDFTNSIHITHMIMHHYNMPQLLMISDSDPFTRFDDLPEIPQTSRCRFRVELDIMGYRGQVVTIWRHLGQ